MTLNINLTNITNIVNNGKQFINYLFCFTNVILFVSWKLINNFLLMVLYSICQLTTCEEADGVNSVIKTLEGERFRLLGFLGVS